MDDFSKNLINKWNIRHYFNAENDRYKEKKLIYNSFTKTNSFEFTQGTLYPYLVGDTINRYYKMKGYNVLYLTGVNDMSNSAHEFAKTKNLDYLELHKSFKENLESLGVGYDPNYFLKASNHKLINEADLYFLRHYSKEISLKKRVVYVNEQNRIYNDYEVIKLNNEVVSKYNQEVLEEREQLVFTLDISNIESDIRKEINNLDIDSSYKELMLTSLGDYSNPILSFYIDKELKLDIELERPELIAGISFIALNPNLMDVSKYISEEEYPLVYKYMQNGYSKGVFSGFFAKNPLNYKDILILISYEYNEAIHLGIPQINKLDYDIVETFGLEYNSVICEDKIINSDFLDGLTINKARERMLEEVKGEGLGEIVKHFKTKEIIISSLNQTGYPIPLEVLDNGFNYQILDKELMPIYFNRFNKVIFAREVNRNIELIGQTFNNIYQTSITKLYIDNPLNYYESKDFVYNILELINKDDILEEVLFPLIFKLIDNKEIIKKEYLINNETKSDLELINKINNLNINFITDSLNKYSPDDLRFYALKHTNDSNYEDMLFKLDESHNFITDFYNKFSQGFIDLDIELESRLYDFSLKCVEYIKTGNIKDYVKDIEFFFYKELNLKKWTESIALTYTKLLSVVCPFVSEKVFNEYFKLEDLIFEQWPTY